ncbi:MAG: hypothetical protein OEO21_04535 [Candidatus Krumholzibacteria bacterium]|nr:hypothetical protein [Candidatus Krumholzibacteria bacterium]
MRCTFLLAAAIVVLGAVADAGTPRLPESFSYTIFINGQRAGRSEARVTHTEDAISIESKSWVELGQGTIEISCWTEADPHTFRVRTVRYQGVNPSALLEGTTEVSGDTVFTNRVEQDQMIERVEVSRVGGPIVIEDFDMTYQVLLARALALSDDPVKSFGLVFASTGALLEAKAAFRSEAAVESNTQEAICKLLVVDVTNGSPYVSYYDPERGMPVYLAFPTAMTEAFLDDFFGDEPITRWRADE